MGPMRAEPSPQILNTFRDLPFIGPPEQKLRTQDVLRPVFLQDSEFRLLCENGCGDGSAAEETDELVAHVKEPVEPLVLFRRLRWGGRVWVCAQRNAAVQEQIRQCLNLEGCFVLDRPMTHVSAGRAFWCFRLFGQRMYVAALRKVLLIEPGEMTERFTYQVELMRPPGEKDYIVKKQVPSSQRVEARLKHRFPDLAADEIARRARKFTEKIFPVFLTREAAMLKILERDLPEAYRARVPRLLRSEREPNGLVHTIHMNWLRNGGRRLSQLDFAWQFADMLRVLHDDADVMHLDLRLDNVVITPAGVCFVDFGSAVRTTEKFPDNSLLATLFEEMMHTSQIQKMLGAMMTKGLVTSQIMNGAYGKVDKAVDLFYLAVQISRPTSNPDLRGLLEYRPDSPEAKALKHLTEQILRPPTDSSPPFQTAADIVRGIEELKQHAENRQQAAA